MESSLILIGSGCLVCLMPLAIYLLYLANLNSKPHPVMVSGSWDFTATLLGLSGFILLSGPLFLTVIDSRWRSHTYGNWSELRTFGTREARAWSLMSAGYFLLMLGVIPGLIRSRRSVTAIYNIDMARLETLLATTLTALHLQWQQGGPLWTISDGKTGRSPAGLTVENFRVMNHVLLKWNGDWANVRPQIEAAIEKSLTGINAPPAGHCRLDVHGRRDGHAADAVLDGSSGRPDDFGRLVASRFCRLTLPLPSCRD